MSNDETINQLEPGATLHYDFRGAVPAGGQLGDTVRVITWNIERGAALPAIIDTLRRLEADVVLLQELDIHCARSGYVNVPLEIAKALGAELFFVCEFEELDSAARSPANAVGPRSSGPPPADERAPGRRFHGNAILSTRATLTDITVLPLYAPFSWDTRGHELREPRRGFRSALRATIASDQRANPRMPPLYLYCCHFEVFCGALDRVRQLGNVMADARNLCYFYSFNRYTTSGGDGADVVRAPAFIIAGDLNTMAHGIVRFSRRYACDRLRVLSLGESEACWLQRKVLSRGMGAVTRGCCPVSPRFPFFAISWLYSLVTSSRLVWHTVYGFGTAELSDLDNTTVCLYDPSDKGRSITLDNPQYRGFVRGKLDWMLLSHCRPAPITFSNPAEAAAAFTDPHTRAVIKGEKGGAASAGWAAPEGYICFNENYAASDHKGLFMVVHQDGEGWPEDSYPAYGARYTWSPCQLATFAASRAVLWGSVALAGTLLWRAIASASTSSSSPS